MIDNSVIFHLTLELHGDKFRPSDLLSIFDFEYYIDGAYSKGDSIKLGQRTAVADTGYLSISHPKRYVTKDDLDDTEDWFLNILDNYYQEFINTDVEVNSISIYNRVYYDGSHLNFELFDRVKLKRLAEYNVAFPVSVSQLSYEQINDMVPLRD